DTSGTDARGGPRAIEHGHEPRLRKYVSIPPAAIDPVAQGRPSREEDFEEDAAQPGDSAGRDQGDLRRAQGCRASLVREAVALAPGGVPRRTGRCAGDVRLLERTDSHRGRSDSCGRLRVLLGSAQPDASPRRASTATEGFGPASTRAVRDALAVAVAGTLPGRTQRISTGAGRGVWPRRYSRRTQPPSGGTLS